MWVYVIKNKINDKRYVGQTIFDPMIRFKQHCKPHSAKYSLLGKAIQKYGKKNFVYYKIRKCSNAEEMTKIENVWILSLDTFVPNGYNLKMAGQHCKYSSVSKEKMRKSHLGKSSGRKGIKLSEEEREKISLRMKKFHKENPNIQAGINNPNFGKTITKEQRKMRSKLFSGKKNPFYGKKHSKEAKKRMSESIKKTFLKGRVGVNKGCKMSAETKRKISETKRKNALAKKNLGEK